MHQNGWSLNFSWRISEKHRHTNFIQLRQSEVVRRNHQPVENPLGLALVAYRLPNTPVLAPFHARFLVAIS
jgi:hypothetical protein